ncbi:unnamed protein product [Rhodiola kirilowii]
MEVGLSTVLVSNGSIDYKGNLAHKHTTGGWRAAPFIIVNEVAERLAFFGIAVHMASYLSTEMNQPLPNAAAHTSTWIGAAHLLTLFGAFMADAYLGRFRTIAIFSSLYAVGMILLTLSASVESLQPPECVTGTDCTPATIGQDLFLFIALALIAIGTGGIKPCVSAFGADQFDEADEKEAQGKSAFFNWFFFAISLGSLFGIAVLSYIQDRAGWTWGFAVPTLAIIMSILILVSGFTNYRFQKPTGSAFTRFAQVIVAAIRNYYKGVKVAVDGILYEVPTKESDIVGARKIAHTSQYSFLDKAAVVTDPETNRRSRWRLCTVTQVEELKCMIRTMLIWASTIALSTSFIQLSTFFISQAKITNRNIGPNFEIPAGAAPVFSSLTAMSLVPIYEALVVPVLHRLTGNPRGLTSLQRMGVGLFISIFAMGAAALVENMRRTSYPEMHSMSVFWLLPQFILMGSAEVFTYVGQLEFFYNEATDGTRSISSAIFLSGIGIGSWLSSVLVRVIEAATGGPDKGWLRSDLNKSRLDSFYWILTGINIVNFLVYLSVSLRFQGRSSAPGSVADESMLIDSVAPNAAAKDSSRS